jgi:hypothetical protein
MRCDPLETEFPVGSLETQRVSDRNLFTIQHPLVHSPEMSMLQFQPQFIHQPRHQRQLFGRPNRPADARRRIVARLSPGVDVLQRLGQIELLECIEEFNSESVPLQSL